MDIAYMFTLCLATLGPTRVVPSFDRATLDADWRTRVVLASKSTIVATLIVLYAALIVAGTLAAWRVSLEAVAIAGGIVLVLAAVKTLTEMRFDEAAPEDLRARSTHWLGNPVLTPLAVPVVVSPVGIMVILFFAGLVQGNAAYLRDLLGVLLAIMAMNFAAMLFARTIVRVIGVQVLWVTGWAFSTLQAGLGVEAIIGAMRALV